MAAIGPGKDEPIFVEDYLEARVITQATDQVGLCVYHYQCINLTGGVTLGQAVTQLSTTQAAAWKALMAAGAWLKGFDLRRIAPGNPSAYAFELGAADVGGTTGNLLARQTCGVISKFTGLGRPAYRGRWYVPFPSVTDNHPEGKPATTYVAKLETLAAILVSNLVVTAGANTATLVPVIWHRSTKTGTRINSKRSNSKWGTQRRRGSYGQINILPATVAVATTPAVDSGGNELDRGAAVGGKSVTPPPPPAKRAAD